MADDKPTTMEKESDRPERGVGAGVGREVVRSGENREGGRGGLRFVGVGFASEGDGGRHCYVAG